MKKVQPSVQFSLSVISESLQPHGLQHARLPWLSLTLRACSKSCPSSRCCYPTISSSITLILLPSIFPSIRVFSNESALHIRWQKYWSFSFNTSPSNEYSGLISFRIDWFDLCNQFFSAQLSLWYNLHWHTITGKTIALTRWTSAGKVMSFYLTFYQL